MKNLLLFVGLLFTVMSLRAQDIYFDPSPTAVKVEWLDTVDLDTKAKAVIVNESGETIRFDWKLEVESITFGWDFLVCDANRCYAANRDEPTEPVVLMSDSSGTMDVYGRSNDREGELRAFLHTYIKDASGTNNVDTITNYYIVKVCATQNCVVSTKDVQTDYRLGIFPNPVTDGFVLDTDYEGISELRIFNTIGKLVHTQAIQAGQFCDVSELQQGLYIIQPLNAQGQSLRALRMVKQ